MDGIIAQEARGVRAFGRGTFLNCLAAAVAIYLLAVVLSFSRYGIDFTDESFYLASIAHPGAYTLNIPVTLFGFVYHPLARLLGGDIGALRQANILITFGFGWTLSWAVIRQLFVGHPVSFAKSAALALSLAPMSLMSLTAWLVTPNYNALTFQGLMLAVSGLLLTDERETRLGALGVVMVALGGVLTFAGKPTTAAMLAVLFVVYSACRGVWHLRRMAVAAGLAVLMLVVMVLMIDGSPVRFVDRLLSSAQALKALGSGQEVSKIFRIDSLGYVGRDYRLAGLAALVVTLGALALSRGGRLVYVCGATVCVVIAGTTVWLVGRGAASFEIPNVAVFGISGACIVGALIARGFLLRSAQAPFSGISGRLAGLALLLFLLPHVAAFGSNANYWRAGATVAFFWGLAGVVACAALMPTALRHLWVLPMVVVMQFVAAGVIDNAISFPYRQPQSLRLNAAPFDFPAGGRLVLSGDYRDYLNDALTQARAAGLTPDTPALDLTGRSPGVLYALGSRGLGQPWMVGAYPGSDALAMTSLDTERCADIARSWLLEEPGGPRSLSVRAVLAHVGADPDKDYVRVATLTTPPGAGGHPQSYSQYLLKPTRSPSVASAACLAAREGFSARLKENNK